MKTFTFIISIVILIFFSTLLLSCSKDDDEIDFPELTGTYLGQTLPSIIPEIFAPGIISSTENIEASCTFFPDDNEFYFSRTNGLQPGGNTYIMVTKYKNGKWTKPETASFSGSYNDFEPHVTPDGSRMFLSRHNSTDPSFNNGLWIMERSNNEWLNPEYFRFGMFISATNEGTIYYGNLTSQGTEDILRSEYIYGDYGEPLGVGLIESPYLDAHPCVAPDESYLIFDSNRNNPSGPLDLFVSFKQLDGSWGTPIYFGGLLGNGAKMCATLSPDGKYLFYYSNNDLYWVNSEVFIELNK